MPSATPGVFIEAPGAAIGAGAAIENGNANANINNAIHQQNLGNVNSDNMRGSSGSPAAQAPAGIGGGSVAPSSNDDTMRGSSGSPGINTNHPAYTPPSGSSTPSGSATPSGNGSNNVGGGFLSPMNITKAVVQSNGDVAIAYNDQQGNPEYTSWSNIYRNADVNDVQRAADYSILSGYVGGHLNQQFDMTDYQRGLDTYAAGYLSSQSTGPAVNLGNANVVEIGDIGGYPMPDTRAYLSQFPNGTPVQFDNSDSVEFVWNGGLLGPNLKYETGWGPATAGPTPSSITGNITGFVMGPAYNGNRSIDYGQMQATTGIQLNDYSTTADTMGFMGGHGHITDQQFAQLPTTGTTASNGGGSGMNMLSMAGLSTSMFNDAAGAIGGVVGGVNSFWTSIAGTNQGQSARDSANIANLNGYTQHDWGDHQADQTTGYIYQESDKTITGSTTDANGDITTSYTYHPIWLNPSDSSGSIDLPKPSDQTVYAINGNSGATVGLDPTLTGFSNWLGHAIDLEGQQGGNDAIFPNLVMGMGKMFVDAPLFLQGLSQNPGAVMNSLSLSSTDTIDHGSADSTMQSGFGGLVTVITAGVTPDMTPISSFTKTGTLEIGENMDALATTRTTGTGTGTNTVQSNTVAGKSWQQSILEEPVNNPDVYGFTYDKTMGDAVTSKYWEGSGAQSVHDWATQGGIADIYTGVKQGASSTIDYLLNQPTRYTDTMNGLSDIIRENEESGNVQNYMQRSPSWPMSGFNGDEQMAYLRAVRDPSYVETMSSRGRVAWRTDSAMGGDLDASTMGSLSKMTGDFGGVQGPSINGQSFMDVFRATKGTFWENDEGVLGRTIQRQRTTPKSGFRDVLSDDEGPLYKTSKYVSPEKMDWGLDLEGDAESGTMPKSGFSGILSFMGVGTTGSLSRSGRSILSGSTTTYGDDEDTIFRTAVITGQSQYTIADTFTTPITKTGTYTITPTPGIVRNIGQEPYGPDEFTRGGINLPFPGMPSLPSGMPSMPGDKRGSKGWAWLNFDWDMKNGGIKPPRRKRALKGRVRKASKR